MTINTSLRASVRREDGIPQPGGLSQPEGRQDGSVAKPRSSRPYSVGAAGRSLRGRNAAAHGHGPNAAINKPARGASFPRAGNYRAWAVAMNGERLEVSVSFDEQRGYVASAPELRTPVTALSLGGLRRATLQDGSTLATLSLAALHQRLPNAILGRSLFFPVSSFT
jgi:hypothetical protein